MEAKRKDIRMLGRIRFWEIYVKVNPVRRDVPFHQIQLLDSVVQILDNNIYPIVRLDERVNVRLLQGHELIQQSCLDLFGTPCAGQANSQTKSATATFPKYVLGRPLEPVQHLLHTGKSGPDGLIFVIAPPSP